MPKAARVSQVNLAAGAIKAVIVEDGTVTGWLPMSVAGYQPLKVGDMVMVSFENGDYSEGLCHGAYFNLENPPPVAEEGVYCIQLGSDIVVKYTAATKTLEVVADTIKITGNIEVTGDLKVSGEVRAKKLTQEG